MTFWYIGMRIGGEAFHGKVVDGHYYLATGYLTQGFGPDAPHRYIEVSPDIFRYSQVHSYSVLVTFPLGLIGAFLGSAYAKRQKHGLTSVA